MKTYILLSLSFAAVVYATEASNAPAVAANLTAGAEAAQAAITATPAQAKDGTQTAKSVKRASYARAAAAELAWHREQFAALAKATEPGQPMALIAAIEARQGELERLKAEAEAHWPAPSTQSTR